MWHGRPAGTTSNSVGSTARRESLPLPYLPPGRPRRRSPPPCPRRDFAEFAYTTGVWFLYSLQVSAWAATPPSHVRLTTASYGTRLEASGKLLQFEVRGPLYVRLDGRVAWLSPGLEDGLRLGSAQFKVGRSASWASGNSWGSAGLSIERGPNSGPGGELDPRPCGRRFLVRGRAACL